MECGIGSGCQWDGHEPASAGCWGLGRGRDVAAAAAVVLSLQSRQQRQGGRRQQHQRWWRQQRRQGGQRQQRRQGGQRQQRRVGRVGSGSGVASLVSVEAAVRCLLAVASHNVQFGAAQRMQSPASRTERTNSSCGGSGRGSRSWGSLFGLPWSVPAASTGMAQGRPRSQDEAGHSARGLLGDI